LNANPNEFRFDWDIAAAVVVVIVVVVVVVAAAAAVDNDISIMRRCQNFDHFCIQKRIIFL